MPTKKSTNKLSKVYQSIDQRQLSNDAKEALTKLRMATGNFRKQEGKEADAFMLFYNRLVSKKPTAVKTTPEYKEMIKEQKREQGRKMLEAKKAKQESRQGQGSERDASRPAKPFGWRLKGKHNYRKPTRADISSGRAYYEARINRADSKRTKFPMLERGGSLDGKYVIYYKEYENGKLVVEKHKEFNSYLSAKRELNKLASNHEHSYMLTDMETFMDMYGDRFERGGFMAKGGGVSTKYVIVDENTDRIYFRSTDKKLVELKFKEFKEIYPNVNLSIIEFPNQYANGGYMAKGGLIAYADGDYDNRVGVFTSMLDAKKFAKANKWRYETITFEDESGDNIVVSKDDTFKDVDFLFSNDFANGGYMANGGEMESEYEVTLQNTDSGDIEIVSVLANSIQEAEEIAIEESGLSGYEVIKTVKFSNGGEMEDEEGVDLFEDYEDQPEEVRNILAKYDMEENDYAVLDEMLAELETIGYTFEYDLSGEPYDLRKIGQTGKSEYYAKGGGIKYSTYDNKSMEYIEGEIAHTERSARQFQQMGDYESMEDRKEHVKKLREIYNRKRAESKMANGGEVKHFDKDGYVVKEKIDKKNKVVIYFTDGFDVLTKNELRNYKKELGEYTLKTNAGIELHSGEMDGNKWEGITIEKVPYAKLEKMVNENYAEGGQVFYKESHKMGH